MSLRETMNFSTLFAHKKQNFKGFLAGKINFKGVLLKIWNFKVVLCEKCGIWGCSDSPVGRRRSIKELFGVTGSSSKSNSVTTGGLGKRAPNSPEISPECPKYSKFPPHFPHFPNFSQISPIFPI